MKTDRLDRGLDFLDDDLISEAADYVPRKKVKPIWMIKYSAAAACLLAVIAGAFALKTAILHGGDKDVSLIESVNSSDTISSILSSLEPTAPSSDPAPQISDSHVSTSTIGSDHLPNNPTFFDKLNDPTIVWYRDQGLKGDPEIDPPKPGTAAVTYRLKKTMIEYPGAVFAVKVSFALYQDVSERNNWKHGDLTILELGTAIKALELEQYGLETTAAEKEKLEQLKEKFQLAVYDYYLDKCKDFIETFNDNNIGFYFITSPESLQTDDYNYFICFVTAEQLENFICKETEAFVFDIMPRANAENIF